MKFCLDNSQTNSRTQHFPAVWLSKTPKIFFCYFFIELLQGQGRLQLTVLGGPRGAQECPTEEVQGSAPAGSGSNAGSLTATHHPTQLSDSPL